MQVFKNLQFQTSRPAEKGWAAGEAQGRGGISNFCGVQFGADRLKGGLADGVDLVMDCARSSFFEGCRGNFDLASLKVENRAHDANDGSGFGVTGGCGFRLRG